MLRTVLTGCCLAFAIAVTASAAEPIRVLIVDGQNNHDWERTTPSAAGRAATKNAVAFGSRLNGLS